MAREDATATPVTIFGRTYHLRGVQDAEHLERLASLLDRRMQEVADSTGTADTLKVAILAALNIADDYLREGGSDWLESRHDPERLTRLVAQLDEAMDALGETGATAKC